MSASIEHTCEQVLAFEIGHLRLLILFTLQKPICVDNLTESSFLLLTSSAISFNLLLPLRFDLTAFNPSFFFLLQLFVYFALPLFFKQLKVAELVFNP